MFPEKGSSITPGAWVVSLRMEKNRYFAAPLHKISPAYLHELTEGQRKEVLDALWEEHRDAIVHYFGEKLDSDTDARVQVAVAEVRSEYEEQIRFLKAENADLEDRCNIDKAYIASLRGMLEELRDVRPAPPEEKDPGEDGLVRLDAPDLGKVKVVRTGPKTLKSQYFKAPKYFAHISKDLSILVIREHEFGTAVVFGDTLVLSGLETVSDFAGECEMDARYDPVRDGLVIRLR